MGVGEHSRELTNFFRLDGHLGIAFLENLKVLSKQKVPSDWLLGFWQNKAGVKVTHRLGLRKRMGHRFWVGWAYFDPIGFVENTQKCNKKKKKIVVILLINTRSAYTIHVHMIDLGGKKHRFQIIRERHASTKSRII